MPIGVDDGAGRGAPELPPESAGRAAANGAGGAEPAGRREPKRIGPYQVVGRLGSGAMGRVYLGRSAAGRLVAVKTIKPQFAEESDFRIRFAREVAAARRVSGVFTAAVVAADPDADVPWLATAYVPAPSLEELVRRCGPLPVPAVRWLAAGCAEALESIHEAGLVHRDLKPSNVLVSPDGPRVIDFGVARAIERTHLTAAQGSLGTPAYMAPEQARDTRRATAASDVFSLGSTLVFAATGHAPYRGESVTDLLVRLATQPPDLTGLSPELLGTVGGCLERDPGDRPTPAELVARMAPFVDSEGHEPGRSTLPAAALAFIEEHRQDPLSLGRSPGARHPQDTIGSQIPVGPADADPYDAGPPDGGASDSGPDWPDTGPPDGRAWRDQPGDGPPDELPGDGRPDGPPVARRPGDQPSDGPPSELPGDGPPVARRPGDQPSDGPPGDRPGDGAPAEPAEDGPAAQGAAVVPAGRTADGRPADGRPAGRPADRAAGPATRRAGEAGSRSEPSTIPPGGTEPGVGSAAWRLRVTAIAVAVGVVTALVVVGYLLGTQHGGGAPSSAQSSSGGQGPPPGDPRPPPDADARGGGSAELSVNQPAGDGATSFVVYGRNWPTGAKVTVRLVGGGVSPFSPVVDQAGAFNYVVNQSHEFFPGALPPGTHRVRVSTPNGPTSEVSFSVHP